MSSEPAPSNLLGRLDAAIFKVEQRLSGGLMLAMGALMFLDVVHRVFSRSPGRLATFLAGWLGGTAEGHDQALAPALTTTIVLLLAYGAVRSRDAALPAGRALALAVGGTTVLIAVVQAFVRLVPEGIVWAPYVALCLLLWVGLLGASMATYAGRHLALEMGEKLWPEKVRPIARASAKLVAGGFTAFLAALGASSLMEHFASWSESPQSAVIPAAEIPKWIVFSVIPFAFLVMTARFVGYATGLLPTPPETPEFDLGQGGVEEQPR
jgi:TRAP-type C4-dicarboxylate transport system permease small subunit